MATTSLATQLTPTAPAPCSAGEVPPLAAYLARVPDPRDPRGVRHPLPAILGLICCGLLCGIDQLGAVADWGRHHSAALIQALGFTRPQTPCASTLHYWCRTWTGKPWKRNSGPGRRP